MEDSVNTITGIMVQSLYQSITSIVLLSWWTVPKAHRIKTVRLSLYAASCENSIPVVTACGRLLWPEAIVDLRGLTAEETIPERANHTYDYFHLLRPVAVRYPCSVCRSCDAFAFQSARREMLATSLSSSLWSIKSKNNLFSVGVRSEKSLWPVSIRLWRSTNQRSDESAAAEDSTRAAARRPPPDSRLSERRSLKE